MNYTEYNDYLTSYSSFLLREAYNQERIAVCINEAVLLAEGAPVSEFHILHEGFTDKIKEIWNKFVGFINKIWLKFKSFFDRILDTDKGWVEEYKTIITQRPIKLEVSMTNYQESMIAATHPERFDPAKVDTMLKGNNEYAKSIPGLASVLSKHNGSDNVDDIKASIKLAMCGGSEEEKEGMAGIINMTNVYNFVHDYKEKIYNDLQKDMNAIIASAKAFEDLMNELESDAKAKAAEAETNAAPNNSNAQDANGNGSGTQGNPPASTGQQSGQSAQSGQAASQPASGTQAQSAQAQSAAPQNTQPQAATSNNSIPNGGKKVTITMKDGSEVSGYRLGSSIYDAKGNRLVYGEYKSFKESSLYLDIPFIPIREAITTSSGGEAGDKGAVNKGGMAGGVSTQADTRFTANQKGLQGKEATKDAVAVTKAGKTQAEIEQAVTVYRDVNQAIQSVKQTICTQMYQDYKDLIKAHIASYVGEKDSTDGSKSGTNFKNGQPQGTPGNPNPEPQQAAAPGSVQ